MVHQRDRRIHFQSGFFGSFDAPWSERSWIDLFNKETQNPFSDSIGFKNPILDFFLKKRTLTVSREIIVMNSTNSMNSNNKMKQSIILLLLFITISISVRIIIQLTRHCTSINWRWDLLKYFSYNVCIGITFSYLLFLLKQITPLQSKYLCYFRKQ